MIHDDVIKWKHFPRYWPFVPEKQLSKQSWGRWFETLSCPLWCHCNGDNISHNGMLQGLTDDQSALVEVMAWCCQAASHYLSQRWPRSMSSYGVTPPQKVHSQKPIYIQYGDTDLGQHWLNAWQHQATAWALSSIGFYSTHDFTGSGQDLNS